MLSVAEAQADAVRADLADVARKKIQASSFFESIWVMELLDSRREDVREVGWRWLTEDERAAHDTTNWQRLMETPYDDIQLRMVKLLEAESAWPDEKPLIATSKLDSEKKPGRALA